MPQTFVIMEEREAGADARLDDATWRRHLWGRHRLLCACDACIRCDYRVYRMGPDRELAAMCQRHTERCEEQREGFYA